MESLVRDLESVVQSAAAGIGPSVVGMGRGWGGGSGVVIEAGRVLTNFHNLRDEEVVVAFPDERRARGRVMAADEDLDLAVIDVDTGDAPPLVLSEDADGAAIGRLVLALANPGGRGLRVTPGFVSCASASFRGPRGRKVAHAIEHTAPLPRGSSGGPLVDADGRLLGINAVRVDPGLILAIPVNGPNLARVRALAQGEAPKRVRLGVAVAPPRVARRLRHAVGLPERDGILVRAVDEGSPAGRAGLQRGDLIVAAAAKPISRLDDLYEALETAVEAAGLELGVLRGTEEQTIHVSF